jgi:hypothetical protein
LRFSPSPVVVAPGFIATATALEANAPRRRPWPEYITDIRYGIRMRRGADQHWGAALGDDVLPWPIHAWRAADPGLTLPANCYCER